jgi:hypothetical protein
MGSVAAHPVKGQNSSNSAVIILIVLSYCKYRLKVTRLYVNGATYIYLLERII